MEPAYPMRFEELGVPDKEIEDLLRAKDSLYSPAKLPATKPVIDRYTNWIQEFLASKGITEPIAGKVTQTAAEQYAIVFRPARNLPAVAQVTFQGNQVVPQGVLREAVHGTAIGSPYTERAFRELLNNTVRVVYEAARAGSRGVYGSARRAGERCRGRPRFCEGRRGPELRRWARWRSRGRARWTRAVLIKAGDFKTGDVANFDRVNEGLERIRKAVRRAGYLT